jgi:hypothetical protein
LDPGGEIGRLGFAKGPTEGCNFLETGWSLKIIHPIPV